MEANQTANEPHEQEEPTPWWSGQRLTGVLMAVIAALATYIAYLMGL